MKPRQTKPLYLALTLLALSMLAFSLIAPLCLGSSQKWKTFESKEWGFRIKYPADWEIYRDKIKTIEGKKTFEFKCGPPEVFSKFEGPWTEAFLYIEIGNAYDKTPKELLNEALAEMEILISEEGAYLETKKGKCTLGGLDAVELNWIYKEPDSKKKGQWSLTQKAKGVMTVKDDKFYVVGFETIPMEIYEKWIDKANRSILSFEFR